MQSHALRAFVTPSGDLFQICARSPYAYKKAATNCPLFDKAKRPILDAGFAIICEGQLDLIACHSAGVGNVVAPQVPVPAQEVAAAAYADEAHVAENRRLYARKFDLADAIIGARFGYRRPAGGFYLWLDVSSVGGSEAAAVRLWRDAGLRVLPGRYIARDQADGANPGANFIRVALVQDEAVTTEALHRLVAALD